MHQTDRRASHLTLLQFGFDRDRLYVRLDASRPVADLLVEGYEFSLKFIHPEGVRFSIRQTAGRLRGLFWDRRPKAPHWVERGTGGAAVAAGSGLELALPLRTSGSRLEMWWRSSSRCTTRLTPNWSATRRIVLWSRTCRMSSSRRETGPRENAENAERAGKRDRRFQGGKSRQGSLAPLG